MLILIIEKINFFNIIFTIFIYKMINIIHSNNKYKSRLIIFLGNNIKK